jgi:hypothetical protein
VDTGGGGGVGHQSMLVSRASSTYPNDSPSSSARFSTNHVTFARQRFVPPDTRKPTGSPMRCCYYLQYSPPSFSSRRPVRQPPARRRLRGGSLFIGALLDQSRHLCATAVRPARYAETDRVGGEEEEVDTGGGGGVGHQSMLVSRASSTLLSSSSTTRGLMQNAEIRNQQSQSPRDRRGSFSLGLRSWTRSSPSPLRSCWRRRDEQTAVVRQGEVRQRFERIGRLEGGGATRHSCRQR